MKRKLLFLFLLFLSVQNAFGIGFKDVWNMLRDIYDKNGAQLERLKQIESSNDAIKDLSSEISENTTAQLEAMTGNYKMGKILNDRDSQKERLWSSGDWRSLLSEVTGGNADRFNQLMKTYKEQYPELTNSEIVSTDPNDIKARFYSENAKTNRVAMAASVYSYEKINDQIRNMQLLLSEIDKAPNQKAAIDLNSRINVELGFIQLQLLKLQTMQTQLLAMNAQDKTNGVTVDSKFIQWK